MMPDTVEIEDIATTKVAAAIDPDGDYLVGQSAAGNTFRALVEEVVRGVLAGIISDLEIGDDVSIDGRLGIGTTSPVSIFHTKANDLGLIIQTVSVSNKRTQFMFMDSSGTITGRVGVDISNADSNNLQLVAGSGSTPHVHINSSGNVGIGTTSPSTKLQINGAIAIVDGLTAPTAITGYAQLYIDSADGDLKIRFGDGTTKTIATDT